jgi:hypothetical protein
MSEMMGDVFFGFPIYTYINALKGIMNLFTIGSCFSLGI